MWELSNIPVWFGRDLPSQLKNVQYRSLLGATTNQPQSSSSSHEKWFVIYGFTIAHTEVENFEEDKGISCSDVIKATYAKGVRANTCLPTVTDGYIKVACHGSYALLTRYLDNECKILDSRAKREQQDLGCQATVVDPFSTHSGIWIDDFDGESAFLRSLLFACTSSMSSEERIPLPMSTYTASRYYTEKSCDNENMIAFHAIRNHVCVPTSTFSSSKYIFPKHTRYSPSRMCSGDGFQVGGFFTTNCTKFVSNEVLGVNGHRIGQVSFPFVSSTLIEGKTSINDILNPQRVMINDNFIIISVVVAVILFIITLVMGYLHQRMKIRSHNGDDRDTSLDISVRDDVES